MVQEVYPVMDVHPVRLLVRDEADNRGLLLLTIFQQPTQRVLHRNAQRPLSLAQTEEQPVKVLVFYRVVYLAAVRLRRDP